jgi:hypothetical protein
VSRHPKKSDLKRAAAKEDAELIERLKKARGDWGRVLHSMGITDTNAHLEGDDG